MVIARAGAVWQVLPDTGDVIVGGVIFTLSEISWDVGLGCLIVTPSLWCRILGVIIYIISG